MALSVTRAKVKERCGITGTTYDAPIDNLITDHVAAVEFAVRPEHIADTGNSGLQATLNLGAMEIVCGEFVEQLYREPGALEMVRLGDFELFPPSSRHWGLGFDLKAQGWARLAPYLKADPSGLRGVVAAGGEKGGEE